ncbi:YhbD family protein [Paenibacillus sp. FSL R7-0345]|uniref:YhbD family protein n=1 Tax=Paenibacillus sp. FSL R7-0345 TaxID=2954535 RepID=UPI00315997C9
MEEELISKKELLELTGISYGQLYRWKRKQLIPEEWFIRKSVFTGQETFFPKERILGRIHNIINLKDGFSLDELADKLTDTALVNGLAFTADQIIERNIVSRVCLERFGDIMDKTKTYDFGQVVQLFTLDRLLSGGELNLDEADQLFHTLAEQTPRFGAKGWELFFIRKMGVSFFLLSAAPAEILFDKGARLVVRISLTDIMEQLNGKLNRP